MVGYQFLRNVIWIKLKVINYLPNILFLFLMVFALKRRCRICFNYSSVPTLPYFIPRRVKTILEVHDFVNLEFVETMCFMNKFAKILFFNRDNYKADIL